MREIGLVKSRDLLTMGSIGQFKKLVKVQVIPFNHLSGITWHYDFNSHFSYADENCNLTHYYTKSEISFSDTLFIRAA